MYKNKLFQSSGTKNKLHAKFRDENNTFAKNKKDFEQVAPFPL
jgi:hypothetical protein